MYGWQKEYVEAYIPFYVGCWQLLLQGGFEKGEDI